jgi:hypothetical protein
MKLLFAAVGIPVMALTLFAVLEGALTTRTVWQILTKSGLDLCILGVGIVGGTFLNEKLQARVGASAPIVAVGMVLADLILAATVLLVTSPSRFKRLTEIRRAYACVFIGVVAVALPSGLILNF